MTDYISRADAIDAVAEEWLSEASAESPYVNDYDIDKYRELAEDLFKDIPSADAVSREEYEELYRKAKEVNGMANDILADFPSYKELVSVVRCKDCRHRDLFSCPLADNDFQKDEDFCSWGERRKP